MALDDDSTVSSISPGLARLPIGTRIGPYEIVALIGAGGMGVVYRARDARLGRDVAIKLIPSARQSADALKRFEIEARAAGSINHSNILSVHDVGAGEYGPWLVAEFLEGQSLRAALNGPLPVEQVLDYAMQLANGLSAAHDRGVVHRDLKPENLFVTSDGRLKILDFGIAKFLADDAHPTATGRIIGTPAYMSPEQRAGSEIDQRTDIYSFGAILCELLTGQRAQQNRTLPANVPEALAKLVRDCMQEKPEDRPQSGRDLVARLRSVGIDRPQRRRIHPAVAAAGVGLASLLTWTLMRSRSAVLSGTDTLVLADFANSTGDPVFDGTLRQGMAVQLEQSPFLSLVSDDRIEQVLRLMGRPPDVHVKAEIAREVCERMGSTVVLDGSIAALGTQYVLGLRARNCRNGEVLDNEIVQAARKEDVLKALDEIATRFRKRVGESLTTIQSHATPLAEATTPSLEALKAYSKALQVCFATGYSDGLPFLKRAVEIDPQFAVAYAHLGLFYSILGESALARESTIKAYQLRGRASDRERFFISTLYDRQVTGNLEKELQTLRLWAQTYPRDRDAHGLQSGYALHGTGQYERAIAEARIALGIDPDFTPGFGNLVSANFYLDRFAESEKVAVQMVDERRLAWPQIAVFRYYLALLNGDAAGMDRVAAHTREKPDDEDWMLHAQALVLARSGQLLQASATSHRAVEIALRGGQKEKAATYKTGEAIWQAWFGDAPAARRIATEAFELSHGRDVEYAAALALILAGDVTRSRELAADLDKRFPEDTSVQTNYLPVLRALFALNRRENQKAIEALQASIPYELAVPQIDFNAFFGSLYPVYVRGEAYLTLGQGDAAAREFQKLLDHRGLVAGDPIGALARLQLGRARTLAGDKSKARSVYDDLLALWKDADPDIQIVKQARAESAKLQ
jgi:tetratricopeptide (TPR) repeat protein